MKYKNILRPIPITIIIAVGIIILFGYRLATLLHIMDVDDEKDQVKVTKDIPQDYIGLFKDTSKLTLDKTIYSKTRNPIAQFYYDENFRITIYKIKVLSNRSLDKLIEETHVDNHMSHKLTYYLVDRFDSYEIFYKAGLQEKLSRIYLNTYGDNTQIIKKNDSLAFYYSKFENFYIKYNTNSAQDFFGSVREGFNTIKIPIEIMFLKRNGNLYLIFLYPINGNSELSPKYLLNLIADK